ncbi:MAG: fatty acid desaturase [Geminicoccaceae bacterium]
MRPRHGVPDRVDQRCGLRARLVHGVQERHRLALEPCPPSHRHHHRRPRPRDRGDAAARRLAGAAQLPGAAEPVQWLQADVPARAGRLTPDQASFIPESEWPKVFLRARIYLAAYALVIIAAIAFRSWLPLLYVGLPNVLGGWLIMYLALTQHVGLAEDVLDHRLNTRTIHMNPLLRFLYLNMNYHVEHHMLPMVPYHSLPAPARGAAGRPAEALPQHVRGLSRDHPRRCAASSATRPSTRPGASCRPSARPFRPELHAHGFAEAG